MKKILALVLALAAGAAGATVPSSASSASYACNGTTTVYAAPFRFFSASDLVVTTQLIAPPYTETSLVLTTDYTVSGAGVTAGGAVTLTAGSKCTTGYTLVIKRTVALTQTRSLRSSGGYSAPVVEDALDKLTMGIAQVGRDSSAQGAEQAAASANSAASSASSASASATGASTSASAAATSATSAAAAKTAAEAARDAANVSGRVYPDTATGLANTVNGQYFSIPSASAGGYLDLYKNNAGVALYVNTYPSLAGVLAARVVGEVFSGLITPIATPGFPDGLHFSLTVAAGTKVRALIPTQINQTTWPNPVEVTLTAGTFAVLDASGAPPNWAWWLYCDRAGTLAVANTVPSSEHIILAYANYFQAANNFKFTPLRPTIHFLTGPLGALQFQNTVLDRSEFDFVRDFGGVGDGATSNLPALTNLVLYQASRSATGLGQFTVRVPAGTYVLPTGTLSGMNLQAVHFVGDDRATVIFTSSNLTLMSNFNFNYAENITFYNVTTGGYSPPDNVVFRHCLFKIDATASGLTALYWLTASPAAGGSTTVEDNIFENGTQVYIPIWINGAKNAAVRNNTLTGDASHMVRIAGIVPGGRTEITGNVITPGASGFTTGTFVGSDRNAPIENLLIQGNKISGFNEEGISLDGFGNSPGLVPTICNGTVTAVSNDVNGRLVITPSMVYYGTNVNQPCPISLRSDWTTYYATLGQGSGTVEGTVAKIKAFDSVAGTITLDVFTPAANVTLGGDFGVQAGFFSPVIRDNVLSAGYGTANNYATAISLWLNVFGALVDGNTVYGGANAINVAGGLMLSTYYTLAWHNVVRHNRFLQTNQVAVALGQGGAVRAVSYYGGRKQYGNRFEGNLISGGVAYLEQQANLFWDNSMGGGASLVLKYCANTLPTADASQVGRRFMRITDDGSGNPTEISYWVVKLSGGVYSWVAAP